MKLLLKNDVRGLGKSGTVVEVADGYARNYLLPKKLAIKLVGNTRKQAEQMQLATQRRREQMEQRAQEIEEIFKVAKVVIFKKASKAGHLYGSVNESEISEAIKEQLEIDIDRRSIHLTKHLKELGTHHVEIEVGTHHLVPLTVEIKHARNE